MKNTENNTKTNSSPSLLDAWKDKPLGHKALYAYATLILAGTAKGLHMMWDYANAAPSTDHKIAMAFLAAAGGVMATASILPTIKKQGTLSVAEDGDKPTPP